MGICVKSEVGQLKRVMLHRPGRELEQLVPHTLERLLFDDIPYLKKAQEEHDCFADILRENGTEVVYLEDLMAQVLTCIHKSKKNSLIPLSKKPEARPPSSVNRLRNICILLKIICSWFLKPFPGSLTRSSGTSCSRKNQPVRRICISR